jgi:hypothetical protein
LLVAVLLVAAIRVLYRREIDALSAGRGG